jgi:hypothetical protein
MLERCENPKAVNFGNYGGRGIKVCRDWHKFENFYADMGPRPDRMTLERINNDGNYELGNVKWATYREQSGHRRNTSKYGVGIIESRGGFRFSRSFASLEDAQRCRDLVVEEFG